MSKPKILSGYDLVAIGFTKIEATLPKLGLKDVLPNSSWLEQKQIHSALDARKHLMEVERIEKSGALSIAVWKEDRMLAEVIQKVGGHWQFLGHNIGNQLYLYPEEALYLMEVNCLQLIHNNIKVSLQQAYTLLLRGKVTILQYKVYSSLSRLGYRLFRHQKPKLTEYEKKIKLSPSSNREDIVQCPNKCSEEGKSNDSNENSECKRDNIEDLPSVSSVKSVNIPADTDLANKTEVCDTSTEIRKQKKSYFYQRNVEKLKSKRIKPCNNEIIHKCFEDIPSLLQNQTVTINVPKREYIPKDINIDKTTYDINLENIQKKFASPPSSDFNIYSQSDEASGSHIRRLRNTSNSQSTYSIPPPMVFPTQNVQFRFFNYWRPAQAFNLNFLFQRPYIPRRLYPQFGPQFMPHLGTHIRLFFNNRPFLGNQFINNVNVNQANTSIHSRSCRRRSNAQNDHLEAIKRLASRLKQFFMMGNTNNQNIESLQRLIHTYNVRYKTKVRLTNDFDIENEQNIVDTIILEDDDEPQRKKRRPNQKNVDESFEHSLHLLKELAEQLKDIEQKGQSTPKHRRAFTKVLKSFNDTYNVEYYFNNEYVVIDSRHITVASTSDSDCRIEEIQTQSTSVKKLKNPFNIMKRLSETQTEIHEVPSCANIHTDNVIERDKQYSQHILDTFSKNWLPPEDDFGRAEVLKNDDNTDFLIDNKHEEFLYDFFTVQQNKFNNWIDLKLSFFKSLEKAFSEFQSITSNKDVKNSSLKSEDSVDVHIIDKLKIIKTASTINRESNLMIDFDVYNRNVQNFKKTKPPLPHFRIICLNESSAVPSGEELAALNAEYDDNVTIVYAIVGDASVSYVRINPTELPVYISSNTKMQI